MSAPRVTSGSQVAQLQRYVLAILGIGRAYRAHVDVKIRRAVVVPRGTRSAINFASLEAMAVSNYLAEIGDQTAADRWREMSDDLSSAWRPR